ncbi:hypothetical protein Y1Q_0009332 [Alligator mississippiensis]|uniref:C-type lectin domain-containing protein n=1 Tax=Alligator mississippiensis TaxID=8496 RepID=A0A151N7B9_ALLMI|nr:hypothetical protein Y1Q_0009332 [Alligator mississippiensis]
MNKVIPGQTVSHTPPSKVQPKKSSRKERRKHPRHGRDTRPLDGELVWKWFCLQTYKFAYSAASFEDAQLDCRALHHHETFSIQRRTEALRASQDFSSGFRIRHRAKC